MSLVLAYGTFPTSNPNRRMAAFGSKADMTRTGPYCPFMTQSRHSNTRLADYRRQRDGCYSYRAGFLGPARMPLLSLAPVQRPVPGFPFVRTLSRSVEFHLRATPHPARSPTFARGERPSNQRKEKAPLDAGAFSLSKGRSPAHAGRGVAGLLYSTARSGR